MPSAVAAPAACPGHAAYAFSSLQPLYQTLTEGADTPRYTITIDDDDNSLLCEIAETEAGEEEAESEPEVEVYRRGE